VADFVRQGPVHRSGSAIPASLRWWTMHELSYGSDFPFIPDLMNQYLAKVVRNTELIKGTEPESWLDLLRANFAPKTSPDSQQ
jgi:hypothetical protein